MAIIYSKLNVPIPKIKKREISNWIRQVLIFNNKTTGNINFIFCSDEEILKINNEFLNHDYYTDIITFDYSEGEKISGDLFISLDTVKSNSEKFKTEYYNELYRVMIHGILHLCGFDDKSLKQKKEMRAKEEDYLNILLQKSQ